MQSRTDTSTEMSPRTATSPDLMALFTTLLDATPGRRGVVLGGVAPHVRSQLEAMLDVGDDDDRLEPVGSVVRQLAATLLDGTPDTLGDFEILGELGRGGMGVVYEGREQMPPRRVALKTLLSGSPKHIAMFEAECIAMASVEHAAVPVVYQFFHQDGLPVLAMELVEGEPFMPGLAGMRFDDRLRLLIELAGAVQAIHDCGIVHRDLKPSNLLLGASGRVRVLDFGVASLGERLAPGSGTVAYMAPEQRQGGAPDPRNDVYSLGAIALRVLGGGGESGSTWTTDPKPTTQWVAHVAPTLPESLAGVLHGALHPDPEARIPSAAAFAGELEGWLEAELLRMLSATAPEAGPAGGGAIRRRAVDTTLAVLRRTMERPDATRERAARPELVQLATWLDEGVRGIGIHGLPGSGVQSLLSTLLDQLEGVSLDVSALDGDLLVPLARALEVASDWAAVRTALRSLGAAVIGVRGPPSLGALIRPLMRGCAPDVRWVVAGEARVAELRPLAVLGLPVDDAVAWVRQGLSARGCANSAEVVREAVTRMDAMPGCLDALVDVGATDGEAALQTTAWPMQATVDARIAALSPQLRSVLALMCRLPRQTPLAVAQGIFAPGAVSSLVDEALLHVERGGVRVPGVVREGVRHEPVDPTPWVRWLVGESERIGREWLEMADGLEERLDALAPHLLAVLPDLDTANLHRVAARLADGLSILGHRVVRAALDEAVLARTPDPLVGRDASMAWVHAIMRRHRRGDMQAVPMLQRIRAATANSDGNLLSQVAHVEASRYAPGRQEPVVAIMEDTWARLQDGGQEAWGAWMVAAQAPISLGNGLGGTRLLELAEDAVASIRNDAERLPTVFARQALSFAWIDFGKTREGAALAMRVSADLQRRGLHRIAASLSTYLGKAWMELGELERAEQAFTQVIAHGVHLHPSHASQWLCLLSLERKDLAAARRHLEHAVVLMPDMEHGLLHHHWMCEALLLHAEGQATEARQRYRSVQDTRLNMSSRRRSQALAGLVMLAPTAEVRERWADELRIEAARCSDALPAVELVLGEGDGPDSRSTTPMIRILRGLVEDSP